MLKIVILSKVFVANKIDNIKIGDILIKKSIKSNTRKLSKI